MYADSTVPEPESEPEPSDSDTDSEPDFDLNVDVMALGTQEQESINTIGIGFELGKKDFVKMLARVRKQTEMTRKTQTASTNVVNMHNLCCLFIF